MRPNAGEGIIPRKIGDRSSEFGKDLERYRRTALEMGAGGAAIVSAREIIISERVRAKCIYPKCEFYGTSLNCPPHAPDLSFMRKLIRRYRSAILFYVKGETKDFAGPDSMGRKKSKHATRMRLNRICAELESTAFYEGYPFSLAFGQGPCKSFWCAELNCEGLELGKKCRFSLKARSSMEAVGMDVFNMAARQGWEIYPCGARVDPHGLPHVLLVGLVLID